MINPFTIDEVRAFWNGVAHEYERANEQVGYVHTQRYEKAMEYGDIHPGHRVLNIWSRMGSLIPWLRKVEGLSVANREPASDFLRVAQARYPEEEFGLTDLEHLSEFPDASFDRVISLETLEHVPNPSKFLQELRRVLKPGGRLIMSLPPRGAEVPEFFFKLFFHDHGEGPHRFLWPGEVKQMLRESGLRLVMLRRFIILPLGNDALTRSVSRLLTFLFGHTPIANFGVRHFYVCEKA